MCERMMVIFLCQSYTYTSTKPSVHTQSNTHVVWKYSNYGVHFQTVGESKERDRIKKKHELSSLFECRRIFISSHEIGCDEAKHHALLLLVSFSGEVNSCDRTIWTEMKRNTVLKENLSYG